MIEGTTSVLDAVPRVLPSGAARLFGTKRHKMTRAGLRARAVEVSEDLLGFVRGREAERPPLDIVIRDHEFSHRRVTLHDEGTRGIYRQDYLSEVADLREQFARRRIRCRPLDRVYKDPRNEADLRTISTALRVMSDRLADRR